MNLLDRLDRALASVLDRNALREEISRIREGVSVEEREALTRRELLETVMDTVPVAIVLLDEVGKILLTNAEARELFFDGQRSEGQNFLQLLGTVPEGLRTALLSETDHIFSFGEDGDTETYHLSRRHFEIAGEPHTVLIVRNMTSELSHRENTVLRKAIRVIHHEFANSIAPVRSLLQGARAKVGKPEWGAKLEQTLTVIEERVLHLSAFLSGFAALGRLPAARPEETAWDAFLGRLEPLLSDIVIAPAPPGRAWFDPAQIEQVIINLVKNAREAGSPAGEIRLEAVQTADGGYRTSVLDRGQGMNDEALENAVVPSFTTKPTGSGMGLTLCREIVDAHQGRLRIARRAGGGIAVSFWLPPRDVPSGNSGVSRSRLSLTRS
jgi:two-component system, NtrC family, nitrogen regulation sensor histidine kinase NtrY